MADAVGSLTKIIDVVLKIKKAVDTVRQNRKDCHHIRSRVERVRHTLLLCEGNTELMESLAVCAAVEALSEVLGEALELVTGCQEETTAANAVCLCCMAGKLSKQLSKVDRATFAILVYHISRQTRDGARPVPAAEIIEVLAPPSPPPPPMEIPWVGDWTSAAESADKYARMFSKMRTTRHRKRAPPKSAASASDGETTGLTLLQQIAGVALTIKVAAETVLLQNKEDCNEIGRRTSRVSILLSRLEDTKTTKDAAERAALEKILETFRRAHAAVVACQRRRIADFVCYFRFQPGKLSDELRRVLDQIVLDIDALIGILPSVPIATEQSEYM